jgi:hypothetical protein
MIGASLSTMGNGGVPNLMVAGLPAYRTVVRYDSEKYATLVLSPSSRGVILLEIGTRFSELDPDLDRILHTLTAELQ